MPDKEELTWETELAEWCRAHPGKSGAEKYRRQIASTRDKVGEAVSSWTVETGDLKRETIFTDWASI